MSVGSLNIARNYSSLITLRSGAVLISGGVTTGAVSLKSFELFDPIIKQWTLKTVNLATVRKKHATVELTDGRIVFIAGQTTSTVPIRSFEIYDPHISWHPSGTIHVKGYDKKGKIRQRVISDIAADSLDIILAGGLIPISQIILPTNNFL